MCLFAPSFARSVQEGASDGSGEEEPGTSSRASGRIPQACPLALWPTMPQIAIATAEPATLTTEAIWAMRARIANLSDLLTTAYFH